MKKGTWVLFNFKGDKNIGIVVKGGKTPSVNYTDKTGTLLSVSGTAAAFEPTLEPQMDTSNAMEGYSIKTYKEAGGDETIRFECTLYHKGKKIAYVSNDGCGGCNNYSWVDKNAMKPFYEGTKQWAKDHKVDLYEPEDTWIGWVTYAKTSGRSATDYLNEFK